MTKLDQLETDTVMARKNQGTSVDEQSPEFGKKVKLVCKGEDLSTPEKEIQHSATEQN